MISKEKSTGHKLLYILGSNKAAFLGNCAPPETLSYLLWLFARVFAFEMFTHAYLIGVVVLHVSLQTNPLSSFQ
jgi:hypothetical protein